jgi:hypothetical protein
VAQPFLRPVWARVVVRVPTHGLLRGLHSYAASRLVLVNVFDMLLRQSGPENLKRRIVEGYGGTNELVLFPSVREL